VEYDNEAPIEIDVITIKNSPKCYLIYELVSVDRLCGLMVRVPGYSSRCPVSISDATKLPIFADMGCHVVSVDPYGRILDF
jgi:hypothetical protein